MHLASLQVAVVLSAVTVLSRPVLATAPKEALFGWQGDTFREAEAFGDRKRWVEAVSWEPRAFVFHGFATAEECDHMLHLGALGLRRSTVVAPSEKGEVDESRTSYGMFIERMRDPIVYEVEQRLATWTQLPIVNQEDIQVLRYQKGQQYLPHYDELDRVCTVLIFLTDTETGGETAFPLTTDANWAEPGQKAAVTADGPFSECAEGHVAVKPRKGDALLFYSMRANGVDKDEMALHTGCPITEEWGRKWTATFWIHGEPFRPESLTDTRSNPPPVFDAGICADQHSACKGWAFAGDCERNPEYMKGDMEGNGGVCRASCNMCTPCASRDHACYKRNREKDGYLDLGDEVLQLTGKPLDEPTW